MELLVLSSDPSFYCWMFSSEKNHCLHLPSYNWPTVHCSTENVCHLLFCTVSFSDVLSFFNKKLIKLLIQLVISMILQIMLHPSASTGFTLRISAVHKKSFEKTEHFGCHWSSMSLISLHQMALIVWFLLLCSVFGFTVM